MSDAANTRKRTLSYKAVFDSTGVKSGRNEIVKEFRDLHNDVVQIMANVSRGIEAGFKALDSIPAKFLQIKTDVKTMGDAVSGTMDNFSASSKEVAEDLKLINKQTTSFSKRSKAMNEHLQESVKHVRQYGLATQGVQKMTVGLSNSNSNYTNSLKLVNGQFDEATRVVRTLKNDLLDLVRINVMVAGSFSALIGIPTKIYGDFQKELMIAKNLTNDFTDQELERFKIKTMEVAEQTGVMAKDIAAAGSELLRLGLNASQATNALGIVADASLANQISMQQASEVGLGTLNAFGLEVSQLGETMDILTRASVGSAADISTLAETIKYAGPVFQSADQSLEELAAAASILSQNMIVGSSAGTGLKRVVTNLQKPTKTQAKLLKDLGVVVVDTATKKMRPFMDIMADMKRGLEGVETTTKNATLATLFGQYALGATSALMNSTAKNTEHFRNMVQKLDETTGKLNITNKSVADGMRTGVNYEFGVMTKNINNAAIEMGEKFAPAVEGILKYVGEWVTTFRELSDETKQWIADTTIQTAKYVMLATAIGTTVLATRSLIGATKTLWGIMAGSTVLKTLTDAYKMFTLQTRAAMVQEALLGGKMMTNNALRLKAIGITGLHTNVIKGSIVSMGVWAGAFVAVGAATYALMKHVQNLQTEEKNLNYILEQQINLQNIAKNRGAQQILTKQMDLEKNDQQRETTMTPAEARKAAGAAAQKRNRGGKKSEIWRAWQHHYNSAANILESFNAKNKAIAKNKSAMSAIIDKTSDGYKKLETANKTLYNETKAQFKILKKSRVFGERDLLVMESNYSAKTEQLKATLAGTETTKKDTTAKKAATAITNRLTKENAALEASIKAQNIKLKKQNAADMKAGKFSAIGGGFKSELDMLGYVTGLGNNPKIMGRGGPGSSQPRGAFGSHTPHGYNARDVYTVQGTPLKSAGSGTVIHVGPLDKYGYAVMINHGSTTTLYAHMSKIIVSSGQRVEKGTPIGFSGGAEGSRGSGRSTGPHLHMEVRSSSSGAKMSTNTGYQTIGGSPKETAKQALARQQNDNAAAQYIGQIGKYRAEQSKHAGGSAAYEAYAKSIAKIEAKLNKIKSNYADDERKRVEKLNDDINKAIYDNKEKVFKIYEDTENAILSKKEKSLEEQIAMIDKETEASVMAARIKYYELSQKDQLIATERLKRGARVKLLMAQTRAETEKGFDEAMAAKKERTQEAELTNLDEKVALLVKSEKLLQDLGEQEGDNVSGARKNLKKTIQIQNENVMLAGLQLIQAQNARAEAKRAVAVDTELLALQDKKNLGLSSQLDIEKHLLKANAANLKAVEKEIELNNSEFNRVKPSVRQEQDNNLQSKKNGLIRERNGLEQAGLINRLKALEIQDSLNKMNPIEKDLAALAIYNQELQDMNKEGIESDKEYQAALANRNQLLSDIAGKRGDILGFIEAQLLAQNKSKNLSEINVNLTDKWSMSMQEVLQIGGAIGSTFSVVANALGGINQDMNNMINGAAQAVTGVAKVAMSGGDPAMIFSGVAEAFGGVITATKAFTEMNEAAVEHQNELNQTMLEFERRTADAGIELDVLTGKLTRYQGEVKKGENKRADRQSEIDDLQKELDDAKKYIAFINSGAQGPFYNREKADEMDDKIATLPSKIEMMQTELNRDTLSTSQEHDKMVLESATDLFEKKLELAIKFAGLEGDVEKQKGMRFLLESAKFSKQQLAEKEAAKANGADMVAFAKYQADELAMFFASYGKDITEAYATEQDALEAVYEVREHEIFMMKEGLKKKLALINLERDKKKDALLAEKKLASDKAAAQEKIDRSEIERLKEVGDAWKEYAEIISSLPLAQSFAKNSGNVLAGIEAEKAAKDRAASDAAQDLADSAGSWHDLLLITLNLGQELMSNDREAHVQKIDYYMQQSALSRAANEAEAKNSKDEIRMATVAQQAKLDLLYETYMRERFLAAENKEMLIELERKYNAERIGLLDEFKKAAGDAATKQFDMLGKVRERQFEIDTKIYDQNIKSFQRQLDNLGELKEDLQAEINGYQDQIEALQKTLDRDDKTDFINLMKDVNIDKETRDGLEAVANPTGAPTDRFSAKTRKTAIEEQIALLKLQNEHAFDYESKDEGAYWKEEARIALIQGRLSQDMLNDTVLAADMTRRERLEIQKDLSDAFIAYKAAESKAIEAAFADEILIAEESIRANDRKTRELGRNIDTQEDKITELRLQYEADMEIIDTEVTKIEDAHRNWIISIDDVRNSFGGMVTKIKDDYDEMYEKLSNPLPNPVTFPEYSGLGSYSGGSGGSAPAYQPPTPTNPYSSPTDYSGTYAGVSYDNINTAPSSSSSQSGIYQVNGGDGNYYKSTSDMLRAQTGLKEGGIIPAMDKYKNDGYSAGDYRYDAAEAVIPLDKIHKYIPNIGGAGDMNVMVTGNKFASDVDFEKVMTRVAQKKRIHDGMRYGQYYTSKVER